MAEEQKTIDAHTRREAVKELNRKRAEELKRTQEALRGAYAEIKDTTAFGDILKKARTFAAYHNKIAKDRVGMRATGKDATGVEQYEEYTLSSEERLSNLDNAAGVEELIAYIERQVEL